MLGWLFGHKKEVGRLENNMKESFTDVKKDFEGVGKWIKHFHGRHEEVDDVVSELKRDISTIKYELKELREHLSLSNFAEEHKQLSKKTAVLDKQTAVYAVQEPVQTAVQTGNFHEILQGLSSNERLLILTLMNSDLKLSYEDLARLLGKERSTVRGQVNAIKQKSGGLIQDVREHTGKKRLFVSDEVREKLAKYAKVRVKNQKKVKKLKDFQEK